MSGDQDSLFVRQVLRCGQPTPMNGLVYPREVIEKALVSYNRLIAQGRALGPAFDGIIPLSRVGFLVEKATLE